MKQVVKTLVYYLPIQLEHRTSKKASREEIIFKQENVHLKGKRNRVGWFKYFGSWLSKSNKSALDNWYSLTAFQMSYIPVRKVSIKTQMSQGTHIDKQSDLLWFPYTLEGKKLTTTRDIGLYKRAFRTKYKFPRK